MNIIMLNVLIPYWRIHHCFLNFITNERWVFNMNCRLGSFLANQRYCSWLLLVDCRAPPVKISDILPFRQRLASSDSLSSKEYWSKSAAAAPPSLVGWKISSADESVLSEEHKLPSVSFSLFLFLAAAVANPMTVAESGVRGSCWRSGPNTRLRKVSFSRPVPSCL
jgi:hypothetical protein